MSTHSVSVISRIEVRHILCTVSPQAVVFQIAAVQKTEDEQNQIHQEIVIMSVDPDQFWNVNFMKLLRRFQVVIERNKLELEDVLDHNDDL